MLADLRECYTRLPTDLAWGLPDYSAYVSLVNSCLEPLLERISTLPAADLAQKVVDDLKSIRKDLELLTSQVKQYEKNMNGSKNHFILLKQVISAILACLQNISTKVVKTQIH